MPTVSGWATGAVEWEWGLVAGSAAHGVAPAGVLGAARGVAAASASARVSAAVGVPEWGWASAVAEPVAEVAESESAVVAESAAGAAA
ncbi:hypothetical protein ABZ027_29200 [Streptomyces sp. NPDC006332]|uniref:hypothetical protein n=1 Tax=Streptomyces sp. NPDC006332 TaxID=3155456 RepID=UPI0033AD36B8